MAKLKEQEMVYFRSSTKKMAQAVGILLREEPDHRTSYMRILKLLVIADRESLKQAGCPIIGSKVVAMKDGPLHSAVYDLIKNTHLDVQMWDSFFDTVGKFDIKMHDNPGVDELSPFEIEILKKVSRDHEWLDQFQLSELTHDFEDWQRAWARRGDSGSIEIPFEETLQAIGLGNDAEAIVEAARIHNEAERVFG